MVDGTRDGATAGRTESANERLKRGYGDRLWASMMVAVAAHFAAVQLWPTMTAAQLASSPEILAVIDVPDVDIPPAPEEIARPAAPVVAGADVDAEVTIERMDWEAPTAAPPPPSAGGDAADLDAGRGFTPFTVAPTIINRDEVARALDREYPQTLKDAGIGGTVRVAFHIDENGRVLETRIESTSGHPRLDAAAEKVADVMRFTPALNRENAVAVWVAFPITFEVR